MAHPLIEELRNLERENQPEDRFVDWPSGQCGPEYDFFAPVLIELMGGTSCNILHPGET